MPRTRRDPLVRERDELSCRIEYDFSTAAAQDDVGRAWLFTRSCYAVVEGFGKVVQGINSGVGSPV